MAKSNFTKLGTADSVISAHLNGLGDAINKVESILGMKTASKQDYALTPVADQDDVSLQYRIYECDITNWVSEPAPVIYKNGSVVDPDEYVLYPGHGAVVFHLQQEPSDIITADFSYITEGSTLADQVNTNTQDIDDLKNNSGGGGGGVTLPFPLYIPQAYRNAAIIADGACYRGEDNKGIEQAAYDLVVLPMYVPEEITFDRVATNVLSPGGGGMWFLIYKDNGSGYPGELVFSQHRWAPASPGLVYTNTEFTLQPGLYWIGFHSDGKQGCQGLYTKSLPVIGTNWNPAESYVAYRVSAFYNSSTPVNPFPTGAGLWSQESHEVLPALFVRRK